MDPIVTLARLSFIWVETDLSVLRALRIAPGPCSFLRQRHEYDPTFDALSERASAPVGLEGLEVPWDAGGPGRFWRFYFRRHKKEMGPPWHAWRRLAPFRRRLPVHVDAGTFEPAQLRLEAFYYPHGLGIVLTAECRERLGLEDLVQWAFHTRKSAKYRLPEEDDALAAPLEDFMEESLTKERQAVVAPGGPPRDALSLSDPFSVVTIIKCEGVDTSAFPEGHTSMPHRALDALTRWRDEWKHLPLPQRDHFDAQVDMPVCDVLYATKRGRAIWFPTRWEEKPQSRTPIRALSCYHRNLTLASLQVESLGGLIRVAAKQIEEPGVQPSLSYGDCIGNGANILSHLYAGSQQTYRARSLQRQMKDNNLLGPLKDVYNSYGWSSPCVLD